MAKLMDYIAGTNPAEKGKWYLEQVEPQVGEYYKPYIQPGMDAQNLLQSQYGQMAQSPSSFMDYLMRDYQQSPHYQLQSDLAGRTMRNTAAAGGFAGTQSDQIKQAELQNALASKDMFDWIDRAMQQQFGGLQGLGDIAQRGFQAGTGMGDVVGQQLGSLSTLETEGQAQQNKQRMKLLENIASLFKTPSGSGGDGGGGGGSGDTLSKLLPLMM